MLKDRGAMAAEVSDMRSALEELERRKAAADARLKEFRDLIERFRTLIDAGTLEVKIKDGRMLVAMATDVLFASGSADLSKDGKAALTEVANILSSIPDREFQVEGHTDDDPIRTAQFPSNWYLASRRALNVVQHMLDNGMPPERISGASFGEFRPVAPNDSKENKSLNRRIEIVVVPDLSQMPGYDELQALQ
ncbi:MAG: OmpA family protein [Alphaproteobacteria bacterium]|nr:OmpA family protein [Alphaproteobacteria bacterium]MCB9691454.1 OmpA family protein [Alphaproteobacteria bacterium]